MRKKEREKKRRISPPPSAKMRGSYPLSLTWLALLLLERQSKGQFHGFSKETQAYSKRKSGAFPLRGNAREFFLFFLLLRHFRSPSEKKRKLTGHPSVVLRRGRQQQRARRDGVVSGGVLFEIIFGSRMKAVRTREICEFCLPPPLRSR